MSPDVMCFFDNKTNSASYVVSDPETGHAAVIDPVLDFDPVSGRTAIDSAEKIAGHVSANNLTVDWIIETHVHADHLTASVWLKEKLGGKTGIGVGIAIVRATFGKLFNAADVMDVDVTPFDQLFADGATFRIGNIEAKVIATPGHTPACVTYVIGDSCFVGDTMFMPDSGTARCDFPGGDAKQLFESLQKIISLPDDMRLFVCHDYGAGGTRDFAWETTVGEQRENNIHIGGGTLEHDYVQMRRDRDATLGLPLLIIPAVQVNMRAGNSPPAEENGTSYIKVPLNIL
ncbi:MAG: MBL fold metallo-hydrolase [Rhodospirillaceae bacterium]|nr:MBL fold metallo-hydrolase [Rhodospirillaceae bacterium]RPF96294.1 MAG: MBL fold metallo-hydrolase [Rhodospirillaceae bacterium TMED63]RZO39092.1 MAG: MBL fold metallo-hydrolase [Rhodospirillaceae bacterium]